MGRLALADRPPLVHCESYESYGWKKTLLKSDGPWAIYEMSREIDGRLETSGYEVITPRWTSGIGWRPPGSEQWGVKGFTVSNLDRALDLLHEKAKIARMGQNSPSH